MGDQSLLLEPFLDDDEDVRLVQRYASAGARAGARTGALAGPIGAGMGAGLGSAVGYLVGYGVTGVDPAERSTATPIDGGGAGGGGSGGGRAETSDADRAGSVELPVTDGAP